MPCGCMGGDEDSDVRGDGIRDVRRGKFAETNETEAEDEHASPQLRVLPEDSLPDRALQGV